MNCDSLVLLLALHLQATVSNEIFLDHVYKNENDFNNVELRCFDDNLDPEYSLIAGARFFVTPSDGTRRRIDEFSTTGVLDYTLTPEMEGELTCRHGGQGSSPLQLAGESGDRTSEAAIFALCT